MVSKRGGRYVAILLLLLVAAAAVLGGWLGWSDAGARRLLEIAGRFLPGQLHIERVEGTLARGLTLHGVAWSSTELSLATPELALRWSPAGLLQGQLVVVRLQTGRIDVRRTSSGKQPTQTGTLEDWPAWPETSGMLARLGVRINRVTIRGIEYREKGAQPFHVGPCSGRLQWQQGRLTAGDLGVELPWGHLAGTAEFGTGPRRARARLQFQAVRPERLGGLNAARLVLDLRPGKDGAWARGNLQLELDWPPEPTLALQGTLTVDPAGLDLDPLQLRRQQVRGTASGRCRLDWGTKGPVLGLDLALQDVDLTPEARLETALSGLLQGRVDGSGYRGRFDLKNAGTGWKELALRGGYRGDAGGLGLDDLDGRWMGGSLGGNLRIDWRSQVQLTGELSGRELNPELVAETWPGSLNLDLDGRLAFPDGAPIEADWNARLLPSRFLERPVSGEIRGRLGRQGLTLDQLALSGAGTRLHASGTLSRHLGFQLEGKDLGSLLPGAGGQLKVSGWVRRQAETGWGGAVSASGRDLHWQTLSASRLQVTGGWPETSAPLHLDGSVNGLAYGAVRLERAEVRLEGRPESHQLSIQVQRPPAELLARLAGGMESNGWQGTLLSLQMRQPGHADLQLVEPVPITLDRHQVSWAPARLLAGEGESLSCEGSLAVPRLTGNIRAAWKAFELGRLSGWIGDARLDGNSSGTLALDWKDSQLTGLDGEVTAAGRWQVAERFLEVRHLSGRFHWRGQGLAGSGRIDLGGRGSGSFQVSSSDRVRLAWPDAGEIEGRWQDLELGLVNPWLQGSALEGRSSGRARLRWEPDRPVELALVAGAAPLRLKAGEELRLSRADLHLGWDARGLKADLELKLAGGGQVLGHLESAEPGRLGWPRQGGLDLQGQDLDLQLVRPWLPQGVHLDGQLGLRLSGHWQPGAPPRFQGQARIAGGLVRWRERNHEVRVVLEQARLDCSWEKSHLQGALDLELAEYGALHGSLGLFLPARWPLQVPVDTALTGHLEGSLQEKGLLASLMPGMIQESRGLLGLDLGLAGTIGAPSFIGTAVLQDAGGFLPGPGIVLHDVAISTRLAGERVEITRFTAASGQGTLEGTGEARLSGMTLESLSLQVTGKNFSVVDLAELQLAVTPDLEVTSGPGGWRVTGTLLVPEALVRGRQGKAAVSSSSDLVIVDAGEPDAARRLPPLAVDVRVQLGDHVLVQAEGIDARLEGQVHVSGPDLAALTGQGRISVVEGSYAAYGVRLDITRGAAVFAGGPVTEPSLDLLASRSVGEVKAGVRVTGTPRAPVVQFYSEPAMSDTDILAYMVLGHPLGADSGQAGLLVAAAGTLLSQGESVVLQDRLKRELGLDVIDVQSGNGDVSQSLITVGKYLSPQLYVSFGQSVFTNTSQVGLRYQIGRHWQVESTMGTESGVDLYYRITFD